MQNLALNVWLLGIGVLLSFGTTHAQNAPAPETTSIPAARPAPGSAATTQAKPAASAPKAAEPAKTPPPANKLKLVAKRSCLNPGKVTSSVRTAPPNSVALSRTVTDLPLLANKAAALKPLIPDPIITIFDMRDLLTIIDGRTIPAIDFDHDIFKKVRCNHYWQWH